MGETKTKIRNLEKEECSSILEFLFGEQNTDDRELEKYTAKHSETESTQKHSTKEEAEGLEAVVEFSHEIKTPLNTIIAYTELLKKDSNALSDELKGYVENICTGSYQLKNLLTDIIENAKLRCGKMVIRKQSFETKRVIEAVLRTFEVSLNKKNVKVNAVLIQANIVSDPTKFNQVLYNLISNAVKFSDHNSIIEIVSWVEGGKYYFEIKNSGAHINKKEAKAIFNFMHATNTDPLKNPEGSGVGLHVSKEIIEALLGDLEFESNKNSTLFRFSLPLG